MSEGSHPSFFSFVFETAVGLLEPHVLGRQAFCAPERLFKAEQTSDLKYSSQIKSKTTIDKWINLLSRWSNKSTGA